jgi:hypothetical protein
MLNYGIALALFGILGFSLIISSIEGFEEKKDEKKEVTSMEDSKIPSMKDSKIPHPMLTKEEAEKLVKKLMATNSA